MFVITVTVSPAMALQNYRFSKKVLLPHGTQREVLAPGGIPGGGWQTESKIWDIFANPTVGLAKCGALR